MSDWADSMGYHNHQQIKRRMNQFDMQIVGALILQTRSFIDSAARDEGDETLRHELFVNCIYPTYCAVHKRHPQLNDWGSTEANEEWSMLSNWIGLLGKRYLPQSPDDPRDGSKADDPRAWA